MGLEAKLDKPPVPVPNLLDILPVRSDQYLEKVIKYGGSSVGLTDFMPALGFNINCEELKSLIIVLRELGKNNLQKIDSFYRKKSSWCWVSNWN